MPLLIPAGPGIPGPKLKLVTTSGGHHVLCPVCNKEVKPFRLHKDGHDYATCEDCFIKTIAATGEELGDAGSTEDVEGPIDSFAWRL